MQSQRQKHQSGSVAFFHVVSVCLASVRDSFTFLTIYFHSNHVFSLSVQQHNKNNNNYYYFREYVFERKRASLNTFYGHIYLGWFFPATCKEERTSYDDANRQGIFFILKLN